MQRAWASFVIGALLVALATTANARPTTNIPELQRLSQQAHQRYLDLRGEKFQQSLQEMESPRITEPNGRIIELIGVLPSGFRRMYATDNHNAAATISVNKVWPGGDRGYGLTGAGTSAAAFAIWDGGVVLDTHIEFSGGRVHIQEEDGSVANHATHVAGTMVAAGVDTFARGMSYEANLASYDWNDDETEMAAAAAEGLKISNHSYGYITGWDYRTTTSGTGNTGWHWYGDAAVSETEDYGFGYYTSGAQELDVISYNAPYYLIFKSAGNDQGDGPAAGAEHYFQDPDNGYAWTQSTATRELDGGPDLYDCLGQPSAAKNVMVIGAVADAPDGYISYVNVQTTSFTGLGPTDDGRIKPDIVANGDNLYSTYSYYERDNTASDTSYGYLSGTSMSTPNASGGANLVRSFYKQTHDGEDMLASTLKGILIHTADEAGNPRKFLGPDYKSGWGMMNVAQACDVVVADTTDSMVISEQTVLSGEGQAFQFTWDDSSEIRVTICWTDPAGTPVSNNRLNNRTPMLVNDLDLWIDGPDSTYFPWRLDPDSPGDAALRDGPNRVDNVEQVYIEEPSAGTYTVYVMPMNELQGGEQTYSMFVSGASNGIEVTSAPENEIASMPDRFEIEGAYPNPFNPSTTIQVRMPDAGELTVAVYNSIGQQVATLAQSYRPAGTHRIAFNASDLASGVYFVRATMAGQAASTQKVLLLR